MQLQAWVRRSGDQRSNGPGLMLNILLLLGAASAPIEAIQLDAVTFPDRPKQAFVTARQAAKAFHWKLEFDPVTGLAQLNGDPVPVDQPKLFDGTLLFEVKDNSIQPRVGKKRVLVDLSRQEISAWQGALLIMHTRISSGRKLKDTPPGSYFAGKKEVMHISGIYGSKMPFSVHLQGNYFVHGSEQTQSGPGSHGCVRLPMYNDAAKWFFDWVEPGTPIRVQGRRLKYPTK